MSSSARGRREFDDDDDENDEDEGVVDNHTPISASRHQSAKTIRALAPPTAELEAFSDDAGSASAKHASWPSLRGGNGPIDQSKLRDAASSRRDSNSSATGGNDGRKSRSKKNSNGDGGDDGSGGSGGDDEDDGSGSQSDDEDPNLNCCGYRGLRMKELRRLVDLALPLLIGYLANSAMTLTDQSIVGHLTADDFAAMNLANAVMYGSLVLSMGIINALGTLAAQAFGAKRFAMVGIWLQVTLVWSTLALVVPTGILWWFTSDIVRLISPGQSEAVYSAAALFSRWSILSLLPGHVFMVVSIWMESIEIVVPQTVMSIVFVAVNVGLNYVLVFGVAPGYSLGLLGSPIATTVAKILQLAALLFYAKWDVRLARCWQGWSLSCLKWPLAKEFFKMGIPIMLTEVLYEWMFEVLTFRTAAVLAGDVDAIDVTGLLTNLLFFMTPFLLSIYIAVSVRVGILLGDNDPEGAKRSCVLASAIAVALALVTGVAFYLLRDYVALLYTSDQDIVSRAAKYLPLVAIDYVLSSLSYVLQGMLEGQGRPIVATGSAVVGNWMIGITLVFLLSEYMKQRLVGMWLGLIIGESVKLVLLAIAVALSNWKKLAEEAIERSALEDEQETRDVERYANILGAAANDVDSIDAVDEYADDGGVLDEDDETKPLIVN
jgi:MATE family multidrug resistance protein